MSQQLENHTNHEQQEPKFDSKALLMDGKLRKPIPAKVCTRRKTKTIYFLHNRARQRSSNYQSQK
jgi:hypothetical protein